jgi:hypothetical protein
MVSAYRQNYPVPDDRDGIVALFENVRNPPAMVQEIVMEREQLLVASGRMKRTVDDVFLVPQQ